MSYQGQVAEIPVGLDGLNGSNNPSILQPTHLVRADTVSYEAGVVKKEGGASKYSTAAVSGTANILGGWDWWPTASVQKQIVVTDDGKYMKDDGAGTFSVTLASGLGTTDANRVPVFVDGGKELAANNRKLFIFTGEDQVHALSADGATTAAIATPPADWATNFPTCGAIHANRLWGAGNPNDPHRLYYSMPTNHENFTGTGSGSISVYPGVGRKIVGIMSFKGLLIVFKYPKGIFIVDTSSPSIADWKDDRISSEVGAAGPGAFCAIENDLIFMSPEGHVHRLSAVVAQGAFGSENVSTPPHMDDYALTNFNLARLARVKAVFYPAKQEVQFAVPGQGSSTLNMRLVLDLSTPGKYRFRTSERDTCEALWMKQDANGTPRPMFGDADSVVWNLDQSTRTKNDLGYMGDFITAPTDLSYIDPVLASRTKNGEFLEVVMESLGNYSLNVDVIWDGRTTQTVRFLLGVSGGALGSGILGSMVLGGNAVVNRRKRVVGGGRRVSLRGYNSGAGEDFAVSRFLLHFWVGDDRGANA